mgnify:CR=1 FL=1
MFEQHTTAESRIIQWRSLRQSAKTEQDVLNKFANIKILPRYLDYWTPKTWPNPFVIVEEGYFCATGIALLLYQTLGHLKFLNPGETQWKVISNHVTGNDGAVFIHAEKVYNLTPGQTNSLDDLAAHSITLKDFKNLYIPLI